MLTSEKGCIPWGEELEHQCHLHGWGCRRLQHRSTTPPLRSSWGPEAERRRDCLAQETVHGHRTPRGIWHQWAAAGHTGFWGQNEMPASRGQSPAPRYPTEPLPPRGLPRSNGKSLPSALFCCNGIQLRLYEPWICLISLPEMCMHRKGKKKSGLKMWKCTCYDSLQHWVLMVGTSKSKNIPQGYPK